MPAKTGTRRVARMIDSAGCDRRRWDDVGVSCSGRDDRVRHVAALERAAARAAAGERVTARAGGTKVAIVPIEELRRIERLEDEEDLRDVRAARAEAKHRGTIPWERAKVWLGLV